MKIKKAIPIVLLLLGIFVIGGCSLGSTGSKTDSEKIENRINSFVKAYNDGDMEKTIENFDSKKRKTLQSIMNVADKIISKTKLPFSLSDLFSISVGAISDGDMLSIGNRNIKVNSDDSATVSCRLKFASKDKKTSAETEAVLVLKKENGEWYINDINNS